MKMRATMNPEEAMSENWRWRERACLTVKFMSSLASSGGGGVGGGGLTYVTTDCVQVKEEGEGPGRGGGERLSETVQICKAFI